MEDQSFSYASMNFAEQGSLMGGSMIGGSMMGGIGGSMAGGLGHHSFNKSYIGRPNPLQSVAYYMHDIDDEAEEPLSPEEERKFRS